MTDDAKGEPPMMIDADVWRNLKAGPVRDVLLYLLWRMGRNADAWPKIPTIARETGWSERAVRNAIATLKASGHLAVTLRREYGLPSKYRVIPRPAPDAGPRQEMPGAPAGDAGHPRHDMPGPPALGAWENPTNEPDQLNPISEHTHARAIILEIFGSFFREQTGKAWKPAKGKLQRLPDLVAWLESTAEEEQLEIEAVFQTLLKRWAATDYAVRERYPFPHLAKYPADAWDSRPSGPAPVSDFPDDDETEFNPEGEPWEDAS